MRRREVIALLGGAAVWWPPTARSQTARARVGILLIGRTATPRDLPLVAELERIGYSEGRNVSYDILAANGDVGQLPRLALDLVARKPDVIVSATSSAAEALSRATSDIPIVMTVIGDPIAIGITSSMSRPSRNITGFTLSHPSLAAKRLELMREVIPHLTKLAYVRPIGPMEAPFEQQVRTAAEGLGVTLVPLSLTSETNLPDAFAMLDGKQVQAVLVETDPTSTQLSGHIVTECLVRNLPTMHTWYFEVREGALMSYGPAALPDNGAVARYIGRILAGAKVAELPFEEPTQVKLSINLKAASALDLTIPPTLLARADEVIE
jgi:putative ABC transport system substrate-binding protein